MDNDVLEVPLGNGFFHRGQPAAQAFRLHNVVIRVFVRSHGGGRQCRLQCTDGFVGDPEVLLLHFLDRFLPVAAGTALVVCVHCHQESRGLVCRQAQNRIQILVGAVERSLLLLTGPSSSVKEPGCKQRCIRDTSRVHPVRTRIDCFLCPPDLSFHHSIYVQALYAEYEDCLLTPITPALVFLAVKRLDSPHDVDEVAGDVARDVAGDVGVSLFRGPGARKSTTMSGAAVQSVDDMVVQRRSVVVAAATAAAASDGDDLDNSAGK